MHEEEEPGFKAFKINYCFRLKLDSRGEVEKLIVKENECLMLFETVIDIILCVWRGRIGKYHLNSEKLGFNMDREPQARGPY